MDVRGLSPLLETFSLKEWTNGNISGSLQSLEVKHQQRLSG